MRVVLALCHASLHRSINHTEANTPALVLLYTIMAAASSGPLASSSAFKALCKTTMDKIDPKGNKKQNKKAVQDSPLNLILLGLREYVGDAEVSCSSSFVLCSFLDK